MAATLDAIRTKVRRLTRSPSAAQLSDTLIDDYVNTFILYDFPEELRLFDLRTTLTFYCDPYIDKYETNTVDPTNPLYDFKNRYITVHPPLYIAGYPSYLSQSESDFYGQYPFTNSIQSTGLMGDGVTTAFAGTLSGIPVIRNKVTFSTIDGNNGGLVLYDQGDGTLTGNGNGTIDYVSGAYTLAFSTAPGQDEVISSETVPYQPSRPRSMLYFDNTFYVRPIPDKPYPIQFEVYKRPTSLVQAGDVPELAQWWQYIAYGAAKKVFEDRMDLESVQQILPEFNKQQRFILRRTIVQQTNERTSTIYTQQTGLGGNWYGSWGNNNF